MRVEFLISVATSALAVCAAFAAARNESLSRRGSENPEYEPEEFEPGPEYGPVEWKIAFTKWLCTGAYKTNVPFRTGTEREWGACLHLKGEVDRRRRGTFRFDLRGRQAGQIYRWRLFADDDCSLKKIIADNRGIGCHRVQLRHNVSSAMVWVEDEEVGDDDEAFRQGKGKWDGKGRGGSGGSLGYASPLY